MIDVDASVIVTDEQREIAWLRARCADLTAERDRLWAERMEVIRGLGIARALDAGATFDRAVIEAAAASDGFASGFRAARARAEELVCNNRTGDPMFAVFGIRGMTPDGK